MLDSLFFYILKLVIKMYVFLNLNPLGLRHGDCVVRAIAKALDQTWEKTYVELCVEGFNFGDMPNSNAVWGAYLQSKGFKRHTLPDTCPNCFTIGDFCKEYPGLKINLKTTGNKHHDRFIVLDYKTTDEKMYLSGASSKDAGKKISSISKMLDPNLFHPVIDELLKNPTLVL